MMSHLPTDYNLPVLTFVPSVKNFFFSDLQYWLPLCQWQTRRLDFFNPLCKSLLSMMNSAGPNADPCGILTVSSCPLSLLSVLRHSVNFIARSISAFQFQEHALLDSCHSKLWGDICVINNIFEEDSSRPYQGGGGGGGGGEALVRSA